MAVIITFRDPSRMISGSMLLFILFFTRRLSITIPRATTTVIMIPKILNRTFLVVLSVIEVTVVFAGKKNRLRAVFIGAAAQAFCWLFTRFTESS